MFTVFGFYKFKKINSLRKYKNYLENEIFNNSVKGTIILSPEGINGTLAGQNKDVSKITNLLKKILNLNSLTAPIYLKVVFNHFIKQE